MIKTDRRRGKGLYSSNTPNIPRIILQCVDQKFMEIDACGVGVLLTGVWETGRERGEEGDRGREREILHAAYILLPPSGVRKHLICQHQSL